MDTAERLSGATIYVPSGIPEDHWLIGYLGREVAETLARICGGENVYIPCARTMRAILLHQRGLTIPQIAACVGSTQYSVRRILRHLSPERQR
ncbi:MAG: hypothetical protein OXU42_08305 [Deltaproteobacteria bacterium]|nr:hypothetical protein [Deltaproteobacteria bacterium]